MPRIADVVMDCAIYLYPSVQDAKSGESYGGSGFLVGVRSSVEGGYLYAVTNSHVIREGNSSIIRINTPSGFDVLDYKPNDWYHHPNGDDLAVIPLDIEVTKYKLKFIAIDNFLTEQKLQGLGIGAGDEVFMVGRFIGCDDAQQNVPTVRFGNLATSVVMSIKSERGYQVDSYLIEVRSLPGYSGSPVFVHILPFSKRPGQEGWSAEQGPWLLGVDWGHQPIIQKVEDKYNQTDEGWHVRANSGVAYVAPAWKLVELLNIKELTEMRKRNDAKIQKRLEQERGKKEGGATFDVLTKDDFHQVLDRASQPRPAPKSDETSASQKPDDCSGTNTR